LAFPVILIDNSGIGSDIAASGAGPAAALAGTAAATNAAGTVVTLDGSPDLVNVAVDGSHALWVATAAGRQFSPITAKDNTAKTVTVANAYTANLTGQAWGLGGRRATIDHANTRKLFSADLLTGWTVDIQATGTDYLLTSNLTLTSAWGFTAGPITITSSGTSRPVIRTAVSGMNLFDFNNNHHWIWKHLAFTHAGSTRGAGMRAGAAGNPTSIVVADCVFDGCSNAVAGTSAGGQGTFADLVLEGCLFKNGTADAVLTNGNVTAIGCAFLDNAFAGLCMLGVANVTSLRCTYARNFRGVLGSTISTPGSFVLVGNLFHSQGSSGIEVGGTGNTNPTMLALADNVLWGNAAFGANMIAAASATVNARNAYGANTSGTRSGLAAGAGDVTLTADPCVAAASNDFRLNSTAGGGALLKAIPRTLGTLSPSSYLDLGPYQSAGGASVPPPPLAPGTFAYFG
jgi:hypothetical protein